MRKIIVTVGVPASGKTTWAERFCLETDAVNVNRDDVRQELFGPFKWGEYKFTKQNEELVTRVAKDRAIFALKNGKTVVVSDTNINPETRAMWKSIATEVNCGFEIKLFHVDYDTALIRDTNREMSVGRKVLGRMFQNYHSQCKELIIEHFKAELEAAWSNPNLTPCVLSDVDGTVAEMHKGEEGRRKPYEWHRVGEDSPRWNVLQTVEMWGKNKHHVVFASGRDGVCRPETRDWLVKYYPHPHVLFMRKAKDQRPDWVVKLEILMQMVELGYAKPTVVFDDRNQVVDVFREVGLEVFQVQPGDF